MWWDVQWRLYCVLSAESSRIGPHLTGLQSVVATCLRCGGIFVDDVVTYLVPIMVVKVVSQSYLPEEDVWHSWKSYLRSVRHRAECIGVFLTHSKQYPSLRQSSFNAANKPVWRLCRPWQQCLWQNVGMADVAEYDVNISKLTRRTFLCSAVTKWCRKCTQSGIIFAQCSLNWPFSVANCTQTCVKMCIIVKMDVIQISLIWLLPVFLEGISDAQKHLCLM